MDLEEGVQIRFTALSIFSKVVFPAGILLGLNQRIALRSEESHQAIRLLSPFRLVQGCSGQIGAGTVNSEANLFPMDEIKLAIPGTGSPLPCGHGELAEIRLCRSKSAA